MASNSSFSVLLKVLGESSSAVAAISKVSSSLNQLGNSVQAAAKKADSLGSSIQQSANKAQGQFSKVVAAAKKAGAAVKAAFSGAAGKVITPVMNTAAMQKLMPVIQKIKDGFAKAATGVKDFAAKAGAAFASVVGKSGLVGQAASKVSSAWNKAVVGMAKFGSVAILAFNAYLGGSSKVAGPTQKLASGISTATNLMNKLTGVVATFAPTAVSAFMRASSAVGTFAANLVKTIATKTSGAIGGLFGDSGGLNKFAQGLDKVRQTFVNFNDSIRIAAQGITNLGRAMFFFFSIPVAAFLGNATRGAIEFEDGMIRVAKTANLTSQQLEQVSEGIRKVALVSATSHLELAGIAEVVGQLGVQSPDAIVNLTRVFDVFAKSTGQVGADVATTLGQITAAFGRELSTSQEWVWRLANTINILENETAATASAIQTALADFAPFANILKLTGAEASALTATLITLGLSPDETGTALRNLSEYIVANAEDVSKLMGTYKEAYSTVDGLLNALETDALGVFTDMAKAMASSETPLKTMVDILDVLEKRGGRAIVLLAQNIDLLESNLATANLEWEEAKSLLEEYELAMSSTKSQMGLLKNNIQEAGIVLGQALLPVINEIISVAVPAIQKLSAWFQSLSRTQQLNIVMWGAIALAAGPVIMLFGQIIHGISLVVLGFGQFIKVISAVISAVNMLGPAVMAGVSVITSVPGLIIIGFVGLLKILSKVGVDIAGFFKRIGNAAKTWGENLAANIANGLIAGAVRYIARAIKYIADMIASFFESHSPPKAGPLSTIDKWGISLMQTFLNGFRAADFSVLEDISSMIETMLTSGKEDMALVGALKKLAKARVTLSALIQRFNQTGVVDEDLLNKATAGLGDMADEVRELIRLQLRYNQLQAELAEIERRRDFVNDAYDEEIAAIGASNMSIAEKIDAIRAAKRARADSLDGLDKEEESLQEQSDLVKEQLDFQKGMIDALQKQKDIFQQIADILKQMAEDSAQEGEDPLGGGAGGGGGFGDLGGLGDLGEGLTEGMDGAFGEASQKMQEVFDKLNSIVSFEEGKKKLQGFLDGLNRLPPAVESAFSSDKAYETYQVMYKLGTAAANIRDKFFEIRDAVTSLADRVRGVFSGSQSGLSFLETLKSTPGMEKLGDVLGTIRDVANELAANMRDALLPIWWSLRDQLASLQPVFSQLGDSFRNLWTALQPLAPLFEAVLKVLISLVGIQIGLWISGLAGAVAAVAQFVTTLISSVSQVITGIINGFSGFLNFFTGAITVVVGLLTGNADKVKEGMQRMSDGVIQAFQGAAQFVTGIVNFLVVGIGGSLLTFASTTLATFVGLWNSVTGSTITWASDFQMKVQTGLETVSSLFTETIPQWIQSGVDMVQGFLDGVVQKWGEVYTTVKGKIDEFVAGVKSALGIASPSVIFMQIGIDLIQGLINGVSSMIGALAGAIQSVASTVLNTIKSIFGGGQEQKGGGFDIDSILPSESDVAKRTGAIEKMVDKFAKGIVKSMESAGKDITKAWDNAWKGLEKAVDPAAKAVDKFTSDIQTAFKKLTSDIETSWKRAFDTVVRSVSTAATSIKASFTSISTTAASAMTSVVDKVSRASSSFSSMRSSISSATSALSSFASSLGRISTTAISGLTSAFLSVRSSLASAYSTLNSFINRLESIQNTTIRTTIVASGSGANWSGTGTNNTSGWTGTGSVTPKASGGNVVAGQSYMVGEIGPELFIPATGGTIVPNFLLRRMMSTPASSGAGGNITININGPVVRDDTDVRRLAELVARELAATMNNRNRFGGTVRT